MVREVAKDVWIFSTYVSISLRSHMQRRRSGHSHDIYRPFKRFGVFPIGGRSTAVKLSSGDVWVLASTPLNDVTKGKLKELGPVR